MLFVGFWVAVLSSLIPYSLEIISLRRLSASHFGLLMSLEPAVAALAGMLVLGQQPRLTTALAIAMVVVASAGTTLEAGRGATGTAEGIAAEGAELPEGLEDSGGPARDGPAPAANRPATPLG